MSKRLICPLFPVDCSYMAPPDTADAELGLGRKGPTAASNGKGRGNHEELRGVDVCCHVESWRVSHPLHEGSCVATQRFKTSEDSQQKVVRQRDSKC